MFLIHRTGGSCQKIEIYSAGQMVPLSLCVIYIKLKDFALAQVFKYNLQKNHLKTEPNGHFIHMFYIKYPAEEIIL